MIAKPNYMEKVKWRTSCDSSIKLRKKGNFMYKNISGGINMKEEYKKWGIYAIISAALIFIISFVVAYFVTDNENNDEYIEMPVNYVSENETPVKPSITDVEPSYYLIKEEEGEIKLQYINGENSVELGEFILCVLQIL